MQPTKRDVAQQFARTAGNYTASAQHAHGSDLDILMALANPQPDMRVLDIATGPGHTGIKLAPHVDHVYLTDLVPEMVEEARKNIVKNKLTNTEALVMDAEALAFENNSFDLVVCRIAPHHFINIEQALAEVARVLKPDCYFVLEDSCVPQAKRLDLFMNTIEKLRDPTHVRSYTMREWRLMLKAAGFQIAGTQDYRKTHEIEDWVKRSELDAAGQKQLFAAFNDATAKQRRHFEIQFHGPQATHYTDDKVLIKAQKRG